jgi:hypothetical protein
MTPEAYLQWLDKEIEDNDRRMELAQLSSRSGYYLGCATALAKAKEKFLTIDFNTPSSDNENSFTDGLE